VRHLHILCEGQIEEILVRDVIEPHFAALGVRVTKSTLITKRPAGGPAFKGGLSKWPKLEPELRRLLGDSSTDVLTTMFDYYAFPADAPGVADRPSGSPYERVRHVESALAKKVDDRRFLPNLVLHEIEAWVLADCGRLGDLTNGRQASLALRTAQLLPLEGLSTLGSDPARFQARPPVCYRAPWRLPGPDFHRQATTSFRSGHDR